MLRNYQFRLYPSPRQELTLENWCSSLCWVYNRFLEERRNYKETGKKFTAYSQSYELPRLKQENPDLALVPSTACQEIPGRLHKAFQAFFRRCKSGEKPGFPRFKARERFNSFTLVQHGWKFIPGEKRLQGRLRITRLGEMPLKDWKVLPEEAKVKQVTIKKVAGCWYAVFCCEMPDSAPLAKTGKQVGLDVGLKALVTDSDGNALGDLKPLKKRELQLRKKQRELSRRQKGSERRRKTRQELSKAHAALKRAKDYQMHQIANALVAENDLIAVEDLNIRSLQEKKGPLAKGMHRNMNLASWGTLLSLLAYKAEEAGRTLVKVDPRGTTQECSACGQRVPKDLSVRVHACDCGLLLDRDHNAAINILQRALQARRGEEEHCFFSANREGQLRRKSQGIPGIFLN